MLLDAGQMYPPKGFPELVSRFPQLRDAVTGLYNRVARLKYESERGKAEYNQAIAVEEGNVSET